MMMSGITSTSTEVTLGDQQTHEHTIKINNFKRFFMSQKEEFVSNHIEIFSGKKIAFVINIAPEFAPDGMKYTEYVPTEMPTGRKVKRIAITENDKFLSLELLDVSGEGVDPPSLAGKVEIILGDSSQSFSFGFPPLGDYLKFDAISRNLLLKPGILSFVTTEDGDIDYALAVTLFPLKLTGAAGEEDTLQIRFTLFTQTEERFLPFNLPSARYLSDQTARIMKDEGTADMKISCGEKNNKKIFKVHKNFLCDSSPVFRAAIESDMVEGRTNEIYIQEVDQATLQEMINYIYTGDFTGAELNVEMVASLADKYDLPGMMSLLCYRMKEDEDVGPEIIADMLITAGKHLNICSQ